LAEAQQQAKVPKIGWLLSGSSSAPRNELLGRELRALGYVEGKNIAIEVRYAEGKLDRLPALADELVRLKVDMLVVNSTPGKVLSSEITISVCRPCLDMGKAT